MDFIDHNAKNALFVTLLATVLEVYTRVHRVRGPPCHKGKLISAVEKPTCSLSDTGTTDRHVDDCVQHDAMTGLNLS